MPPVLNPCKMIRMFTAGGYCGKGYYVCSQVQCLVDLKQIIFYAAVQVEESSK